MDFEIVNPLEDNGWDDLVASHPKSSIFHTSSWARILTGTYGYNPVYLVQKNNGAIRTAVPVMEVQGFCSGRRAISLPFTDYCDPLHDAEATTDDYLPLLFSAGKEKGWNSF